MPIGSILLWGIFAPERDSIRKTIQHKRENCDETGIVKALFGRKRIHFSLSFDLE
jgi:hypothetical protein